MSKLLLVVGILLLVASVPILLVGIAGTEGNPVSNLLEATACNPSEKLVVESTYWSMPNGESGTNMTYFCEIEPGQRRSVTDQAVLIIGGSFVIPFGIGMLLTFIGSWGVARNVSKRMNKNVEEYFNTYPQLKPTGLAGGQSLSDGENVIDLRGHKGDIPPQAQQILNSVLGNVSSATIQGQGGNSLSARLKQLEEAYENDLITKDEYDKVRQSILDSMDD